MDALTAAAASGMRSRMETLDLLANNIANSNVPGFKTDREFYNLYIGEEPAESGDSGALTMPVVQRNWTDFSQGTLTPTGNPLDVALTGPGFFAAQTPTGTLYTRSGAFQLSPQRDLETREGYKILGTDGNPIKLDPSKQTEITPDGIIRQDQEDVAQLSIVSFPDNTALSKRGYTYFENPASVIPQPSTTSVQQGKLEAGNVQPTENAVRLVGVMRQFESLQRAMSLGFEMNKQAVEEVARVS